MAGGRVEFMGGPAELAVLTAPLCFCRMLVIFSRSILFSLSISVYRSTAVMKRSEVITFHHLVLLLLVHEVLELGRFPHVDTGLDVAEVVLVEGVLLVLPLAS